MQIRIATILLTASVLINTLACTTNEKQEENRTKSELIGEYRPVSKYASKNITIHEDKNGNLELKYRNEIIPLEFVNGNYHQKAFGEAMVRVEEDTLKISGSNNLYVKIRKD